MITSRANALIRRARAVRDGKDRELIFVEGVRLCEEASRSSLAVEDVLYTERVSRNERGAALLESLSRVCRRMALVNAGVFSSLSDMKTPQGVIVIAKRPRTDRDVLTERSGTPPLLAVLHRINNPSNAGAILRAAEAAGATGAVATEGSTDLFSPKALRGAMGSSFRLPLWTGATLAEVLAWCAGRGVSTVSTDLRATRTHTDVDWTVPRAILIGAEGGGLDPHEAGATDLRIRIPMRAPVESLNVAVAAAIVLYEAARQRGGL